MKIYKQATLNTPFLRVLIAIQSIGRFSGVIHAMGNPINFPFIRAIPITVIATMLPTVCPLDNQLSKYPDQSSSTICWGNSVLLESKEYGRRK